MPSPRAPTSPRVFAAVIAVVTSMIIAVPSLAATDTCGGREATILGTDGADVIQGTLGDDVIVARHGDDTIYGNGGNDWICAGGGADWIKTRNGDDRIWGGGGSDYIAAGRGADEVAGGRGRDVVIAGRGADRVRGGARPDVVRGGRGADDVRGNEGRDQVTGGAGIDAVSGGKGSLDSCAGETARGCESPILPTTAALSGSTDFGAIDTDAGATPPNTVAVTNSGADLLEVRSMAITGPDAADFRVVADTGARVLVPGETRTVDIVFDPSGVAGVRTAMLHATTSDAGTLVRSLELTGVATTPQPPPAAPGGLTATAEGPTRVVLRWFDNSITEDLFEIERRTSGSGFVEIAEVGTNVRTFTDTTTAADTVYTYRVRARAGTLLSGYTNEASVVTPPPPPPPPGFDLALDRVYVNQAVPAADSGQSAAQRLSPIAGREGLVRAFVTANQANTSDPTVVLHWRRSGGQAGSMSLSGPASVPTSADEGSLAATFNREFDASFLEPGLEVYVEVDPTDLIPEEDETNNRYPTTGWLDLDVSTVPRFDVTLVPITYQGQTPNITMSTARSLLDSTLRMHPISDHDVAIRAPWTYTGDSWSDMLGQLANLRAADGSSRFYHGIVVNGPGGGIAGIGYVGFPVAISIQNDEVIAHELGHNFDLSHAPCGNPGGPDPSYPYPGGGIGTWGYDIVADALRDPGTYKDIMSYCGPEWISDYNYGNVLDYRLTTGQAAPARAAPMLLVAGSIDENGMVRIDTVHEVVTPPVEVAADGHRLVGYDTSRQVVFEQPFGAIRWEAIGPAAADHGTRFLVTVPAAGFDPASIDRLEVLRSGRVVAAWSAVPAGMS